MVGVSSFFRFLEFFQLCKAPKHDQILFRFTKIIMSYLKRFLIKYPIMKTHLKK